VCACVGAAAARTTERCVGVGGGQACHSSRVVAFVDGGESSDTSSVHSVPRYVSSECLPDWRTYTQYDFHNLVMSGGGSKGYAYIGALKVKSSLQWF